MNPRDIIQARIDELEQEMKELAQTMKDAHPPEDRAEQFQLLNGFKDKILTLRSAIAELKHVKELV